MRVRRASLLLSAVPVLAQEVQPELEEVVVVGTRTAGRSLDESLAPVDLVTPEAIRRSAAIPGEVGAAIQSLVPSFNLPRQSNSNFADLVRPAQLRNLSPDQVLVLVNGKRRHTTATLTTESKLGKGTSPVDFNSIPVGAIKRIEVLRDGAGAQYGSDAIAGVINVVLKDADEGGEATASWGQNRTDFKPTGRSVNDGDTLFASVNSGFAVGDGFLNLTAEYRDRDQTLRSGPDQIPFFENQTPPNLALAGTQTHKAGDGPMDDISFMYNAAFPLGDALELYSFGSYSDRNGEGANFFRYPDSFANVPSIFPDGYIPVLEADNVDLSLAAGLRGTLASDWSWDLSAVYGSNDFDHDVTNSLNVSFGDASPTSFNVGEYKFSQATIRFDMSRPFDVGGFANPLNFAWGLEYRIDEYETEAGDPESYEAGPVIGAPIGTQAGSGLKPEETVDVDRDAVSAYVDVETNLTERFQVGAAARFEDYSDFGNSVNGKVSGRYELTDAFAVRGTVGTGFRAPSLTQAFFRGSTTSFGEGGQLENVLNLPTDDPIALLLGAQDLDAEESVSYNLGFRVQPGQRFQADGRFLPGRHRRPHHAVRAHRRPRGHRLHRGPARHPGRARRALLHERHRYADGRLRHRRRLHLRPRTGEPAAVGRVQQERHRGHARRPEPARARCARRRQRAVRRRGAQHDRDRVPGRQGHPDRELDHRALVRACPRHALGRGDARVQLRRRLRAGADLRRGVGHRPRRGVRGHRAAEPWRSAPTTCWTSTPTCRAPTSAISATCRTTCCSRSRSTARSTT